VQTTLLKLIEETDVPLYAPNDMRSQMQLMFNMRSGETPKRQVINTRNILFIVSGAFTGLDKIVEKRVSQNTIGFGATATGSALASGSLLRQARTQDLISYGFEAEFVGRLPVRVVCDPLDSGDLFEIMKCSAGSLVKQLQREFEAYGIDARFEDSALREIAERAAEEKTGARGLVTAWEAVLRDFKFEMPSLGLPTLEIDASLVQEPAAALERYRQAAVSLANDPRAQAIRDFAGSFKQAHDLELRFEPNAIHALVERAERETCTVTELCQRLFKDFSFGLQLVVKNTGERGFVLDRHAITEPDRFLSDLVAGSYRETQA
jgi:ATP-dependent protease Clp ATPase subunit